MSELHFSVQNIIDGQGLSIAVTGMLIVFSTLLFISLFIVALPKILEKLKGILPPETMHHTAVSETAVPEEEEAIVAAVGLVLHTRRLARDEGEG